MKKSIIAVMFLLLIPSIAFSGASKEKPLSEYSNKELVILFENSTHEENEDVAIEKMTSSFDELENRKAITEIVGLLNKDEGLIIDGWCYEALEKLRSPETDKLLKPLATNGSDDKNYFANVYFAQVGEKFALENLNAHYFEYGGSSNDWAGIVELFAKYKYYPATQSLISTIDAGSLNLAGASAEALKTLYPDTKEDVEKIERRKSGIDKTMKDIIIYYTKYFKEHAGENK